MDNMIPVHVGHQEKLIVVPDKPRAENNFGYFSPIGRIKDMSNNHIDTMPKDIFDILATVPKSSYDQFIELKLHRCPDTNLIVLEEMTDKQQITNFNKRMKPLKAADIFKKVITTNRLEPVTKNTWLLNPYLIVPKECDHAKRLWDYLN